MTRKYLYKIELLNKKEKNPLEVISYYSGITQYDVINSKTYESNTSVRVIWNDIKIPNKNEDNEKYNNLPEYLKLGNKKNDLISNARNVLWKNIAERESRLDSQFARLFELTVPFFLKKEEIIELINKYTKDFIKNGMIMDCAIHDYNKDIINYNLIDKIKNVEIENNVEKNQDFKIFLISTLREYKNGVFGNKNREWNDPQLIKVWRGNWVKLLSEAINKSNIDENEKNIWIKKLKIYPEYRNVKTNPII